MMIPGLRCPRNTRFTCTWRGNKRHPVNATDTRCTGGGGEAKSDRRTREAPLRGSLWPRHPAHPATHTARQLSVPIVGTRRSFPSPTMTPFLSEKKLKTSRVRPGLGSPRVRAGSGPKGPAGRRRTDPRGRCPRPVPRRGPTSRADPVCGPRGQGTGREGREGSAAPAAALTEPCAGPPGWDDRGGAGAPQEEAPNSGVQRAHYNDPPRSFAGPGGSLKDP